MTRPQLTYGEGDSEQNYNDVQQSDNQSSFGHEALAGAASFGAFKVTLTLTLTLILPWQKSLYL